MMAPVTVGLILIVVAAVRVSGETADAYSTTIVNTHNDDRRLQGSTNINKLTWSNTLALEADAWVSNCVFTHEEAGRGENIAYSTTTDVAANINTAMTSWYDEINIYTYQQGCQYSCHYTQMIWYNTRDIGCAMHQCATLIDPQPNGTNLTISDAWYFGCWYDPQGNYISEYPYVSGTACTGCLEGQTCEEQLCAGVGIPPCENIVDDETCVGYESWGACVSHEDFMTDYCSETCGFC